MKTYFEATQFLDRFINYEKGMEQIVYNEKNLNLEGFEKYLEQWDQPQSSTNFIHIAGTKGKGSTAAMLEAALVNAGFHVGLYTSPHLDTYLERFRIDGLKITEARFVMYMNELARHLKKTPISPPGNFRTVFELLTAIALLFFRDEKLDMAIMETGLGGRLDATNIISPRLCIITALGLDHTHLLGDKITDIAWEKGGIVKKNIPLILAEQETETGNLTIPVLRKICRERESPLTETSSRVEILDSEKMTSESRYGAITGQKIRFRIQSGEFEIFLPLLGGHQVENCQTAVAALEALCMMGFQIDLPKAFQGISKTYWPGRFEIIHESPLIILDGAHCPLSARALAKTLDTYYPDRRRIFLLGILKGKNVSGIARELFQNPLCREIITFSSSSPRAYKAEELAAQVKEFFPSVKIVDTPEQAVCLSLSHSDKSDVIVATGSIYHLDKIKKLVLKNSQ